MKLTTLQPWGTYASMVAVAVSVIGLCFQMRINTRSLSPSGVIERISA